MGLFGKMTTNWYPLSRETQATLLCFKYAMTQICPNLRKAAQGTNGFSALMAAKDSNMTVTVHPALDLQAVNFL